MVIHIRKKAGFHVKDRQKENTAGWAGFYVRIIRTGSRKEETAETEKQAGFTDAGRRHGGQEASNAGRHPLNSRKQKHSSGGRKLSQGFRQAVHNEQDLSESSGCVSGGDDSASGQKDSSGALEKNVSRQVGTGQTADRLSAGRPSVGRNAGCMAAAVGARAAFSRMEGGDEFYDACVTAGLLSAPLKSATDYGRDLYRRRSVGKAVAVIQKDVPDGAVRENGAAGAGALNAASETGIHSRVPGAGISRSETGIHKTAPGAGISQSEFVIHKTVSGISTSAQKNHKTASETGIPQAVPKNYKTASEAGISLQSGKNYKTVRSTEVFRTYTAETGYSGIGNASLKSFQTGDALGEGILKTSAEKTRAFRAAGMTGAEILKPVSDEHAGDDKAPAAEIKKADKIILSAAGTAGAGDFSPASKADKVTADKAGIKISRAAGKAEPGNPKNMFAPVGIQKTAGIADHLRPRGRRGTGITHVPKTAAGKLAGSASGLKTNVPESEAAAGAGTAGMMHGKAGIKFSSEKTGTVCPERAIKKKAAAVKRRKGMAAGRAVSGGAAGALCRNINAASGRSDMKNSVRNRMIQMFFTKRSQEKNQSSTGRLPKGAAAGFSAVMRQAVRSAGLFAAGLCLSAAVVSFPVLSVLAVIYNSPFAVCFPSISSTETVQRVLSDYAEEFNRDVELELNDAGGHDRSGKVYSNFTGDGTPDNFCDILAVYMVKYGIGDTASDMTEQAVQNLKSVFEDMCSYGTSIMTETVTDDEGNETVCTVKYVIVELKTWHDMIAVYDFCEEEQEILAELMKPEYAAAMGGAGSGGNGTQTGPGQQLLPEQYQAAVDAASDAAGKKVLEFALSKVGYPYSQALRDSGTHFDCSSLAFYAWKNAGVNISYQGSSTAASEAQLCYDSRWLVHYDEMKPGDLIFYSYHKNGRFMDITHVAVYAGDGMAVEAANARLGVVYRAVTGKDSIVMIGRPGQKAGG